MVRCALICCSCDLPAGRKLCDFLANSAKLGCSKCTQEFPSIGEHTIKRDYSGFERSEWTSCTNSIHHGNVEKLSECSSQTALNKKERELGCRYSALLDLDYFDPPVMLTIDPVHCLYLGLAKHFVERILIGRDILMEASFAIIQDRIDALIVLPDIGRIPHKM